MLDKVRTFIKVAESGSFSKAGNTLKMAPSSITRQIDKLEDELGEALFKRSTRKLVLTEKGRAFLEGAIKLVVHADSLVASIQQQEQEPEGTIRISVFESFGRLHVCPLLADFLSMYPKVKIDIELENRVVDLANEEVDLAIRIGRPVDSGLRSRKLVSIYTILCASPIYLEKHGVPDTPEGLTKHNCLTLSRQRQLTYWHFRKGKEYKRVQVSGNISSMGGTPLLEAAESGVGLLLLSHWMVADSIRTGRLVQVLADWDSSLHEDSSGEVYAVFTNSKYMKPALRAFIDYLVTHISSKGSTFSGKSTVVTKQR